MVTGPDGQLALPWLDEPLTELQDQARQRGHALLIQAAPDIGALELAVAIAQGRLCEGPLGDGKPCGRCASCHLVQARAHPDLLLLMPEALRQSQQWPLAIDKPETDNREEAKPRKRASRQIRIEEVRLALDWASTTSSRGGRKVLVLHPADALNLHAASALLKTLEEPPVAVQVVLTTSDPALLLPTLRSRCQLWTMALPAPQLALAWLQAAGVREPAVLLKAAGGQPLRARAMFEAGIDAASWHRLPQALLRGEAAALAGWPLNHVLDAMQRLCHDVMRKAAGGQPVYFEASALPLAPAMQAGVTWQRELLRVVRHAEHPWQEALLLDSLVLSARKALQAGGRAPLEHRPFDTLSP